MKLNPISWFTRSKPKESKNKDEGKGSISPGRVSQPDDGVGNSELITTLNGITNLVTNFQNRTNTYYQGFIQSKSRCQYCTTRHVQAVKYWPYYRLPKQYRRRIN